MLRYLLISESISVYSFFVQQYKIVLHFNRVSLLYDSPEDRVITVKTSLFASWHCNVKVVPVFFKWAQLHEGVLGEWRYSSTHSLTSALDGGEWSASRLGRFIVRGRTPGTHRIKGWVIPRANLDLVVKRKIPNPPLGPRSPNHPARSPVLYHWAVILQSK
jgi:hypothetical protein